MDTSGLRKNILLHFLNQHAQEIVGFETRPGTNAALESFLNAALRAAILLSETAAVMPPGFFLESSPAFDLISHSSAFLDAGLIELPMREMSLADMIEKKRSEYRSVRGAFPGLFDDVRLHIFANSNPFFVHRRTKIGESATLRWQAGPDEDINWAELLAVLSPATVEHLRSAPALLREDGVALTWPALAPHLNLEAMASEALVRVVLQQNYFALYLSEFELALLSDLPRSMDVFFPPEIDRHYSYRGLVSLLRSLDLLCVWDITPSDFVQLNGSPGWVASADVFVQLIANGLPNANIISAFASYARKYRLRDPVRALQWAKNKGGGRQDTALNDVCEVLHTIATEISTDHGLIVRANSDIQRVGGKSVFVPHKNQHIVSASSMKVEKAIVRRVLIATANEREARAVIDLMRPAVESALELDVSAERNVPVAHGILITHKSARIIIEIALARETGAANAVLMFNRYIKAYIPDAVFFVGCAGIVDEKLNTMNALNERGQAEDLVLIAKRAFDSEKRRIEDRRIVYDQDSYHGNGRLIERFRIMNAAGAFSPLQLITNRDFVSSAAFHASRTSADRKAIIDTFPEDAIVMEQEAFAVYQNVSFFQEDGINIPTLVIKGVSDFGDADAQVGKAIAQARATRNAAQVVLTYLMEQ